MSPKVLRATLCSVAAAAVLTLSAKESRADQFVLFDATFTYTWDQAINSTPSKSHYYVNEKNWLNKARPTNWLSPVNYRNGKVHIRVEVLEKPAGDQPTGWALCYIANVGQYGCAYTEYYTKPGVYERDVDMTSWWNNQTIQWDKGIKQMDLVYTINNSGSGHVHNFPDKKDLTTPTKVRITLVQVSQGDTYDSSILGAGGAGGAGGNAGTSAGGSAGKAGSGGAPSTGNSGGTGSGGQAGAVSSGSGGAPSSAGGAKSSAGSAGKASTEDSTPENGDDASCSVAHRAPGTHAFGLLGLIALGLVRRRVRRNS